MELEIIAKYQKTFEQVAHKENDTEYWLARELQELLGYSNWQNFTKVIEKAVIACTNSEQVADDHFIGVSKMVNIGSGAEIEILIKRNIKPEELPPEEDIKKVERRLKSDNKKLLKDIKKLKE